MRNVSIKRYAIIACLAAISYLLMFISFAVIPIVPYMKVDFADILHNCMGHFYHYFIY